MLHLPSEDGIVNILKLSEDFVSSPDEAVNALRPLPNETTWRGLERTAAVRFIGHPVVLPESRRRGKRLKIVLNSPSNRRPTQRAFWVKPSRRFM
jgi:hypothetical protein